MTEFGKMLTREAYEAGMKKGIQKGIEKGIEEILAVLEPDEQEQVSEALRSIIKEYEIDPNIFDSTGQ